VVAERRRTTGLCASAIVLLAGLTACGSDRSTPAPASPPVHHASSRRAADAHAASRIVAGHHARLEAFSVIPGHPERRIADWHLCNDADCTHGRGALTVTGNGFADAHVVEVPVHASAWYVEPAGTDHFAISSDGGRRSLVDLAGRVTAIHVVGRSGPLVGSEVPLRAAATGYLAVDPDTGVAHPLSTPGGVVELDRSPSGQLRAVSFSAYSWSDDGGETWRHLALRLGGDLPELVPTASDRVHAVLLGGDGATLFPWTRILESTDGAAWTSYDGPEDPIAYVDSPAVLPDGRLLINVEVWSDQRAGRPAARPVGTYVGRDWSCPHAVDMGAPFGTSPRRAVLNVLDVAVTTRSVTLFSLTSDRRGVVASADGGEHWRPVRTH
jgi:hypothetical protein